MSDPTTPQKAYYSAQDMGNLDIPQFFRKVIGTVDQFRSRFVYNANILDLIKQKSVDDIIALGGTQTTSAQESRCHAFFRMTGFPVVSGDGGKLYSSGHDPSLNKDIKRINKNLDVASAYLEKFGNIATVREQYSVLSNNALGTNDANAQAAALGIQFPRQFEKQFKSGLSPVEVDEQQFQITDRAQLTQKFPKAAINTLSYHILKPFSVDPRIEMTVMPAANRICAPFLEDKSKSQLTQNEYLKRPYIERVIEVRFNKKNILNKDGVDGFVKDILKFVKSNTDILDSSMLSAAANPQQVLHRSEIMVFSKFVKIIEALVVALVENILYIEKINTQINWKPMPSKNGLESGLTLNKVDYYDANNRKTELDIRDLMFKKYLAETAFDVGYYKGDTSNFSFSNIDDIVFGADADNQFYDKKMRKLNAQRDEIGSAASECLTEIEMITGEFSGLGLLDVMAIQAALWVISPQALLGLIDDAAVARMQNNKALITELALPGARLSPLAALKEFEKKLGEIYILIGSFYSEVKTGETKNKK